MLRTSEARDEELHYFGEDVFKALEQSVMCDVDQDTVLKGKLITLSFPQNLGMF